MSVLIDIFAAIGVFATLCLVALIVAGAIGDENYRSYRRSKRKALKDRRGAFSILLTLALCLALSACAHKQCMSYDYDGNPSIFPGCRGVNR